MANDEPKRPYYERPKKNVMLQIVTAIVKPLHITDEGTTYQLIVKNPPKSDAAKQVIDG